jgi:adenosine/AMP kinase
MKEEAKKTTKPFHLVITDNETGETVQELDFDVLVGAAHINDHESAGIVIAKGSPLVQAQTVMAVETTIDTLTQRDPFVGMALAMMRASSKTEIKETENQEENEEKGE